MSYLSFTVRDLEGKWIVTFTFTLVGDTLYLVIVKVIAVLALLIFRMGISICHIFCKGRIYELHDALLKYYVVNVLRHDSYCRMSGTYRFNDLSSKNKTMSKECDGDHNGYLQGDHHHEAAVFPMCFMMNLLLPTVDGASGLYINYGIR